MVNTMRYVPILRWEQAEKLALKSLQEEDRSRITPLIEITPKSFDAPKTGEKKGTSPPADSGRPSSEIQVLARGVPKLYHQTHDGQAGRDRRSSETS
jgi:hypothetical protein